MRLNSYYDELALVDDILEDTTTELCDKSEAIFNNKEKLQKDRDAFNAVISKDVTDNEFQNAYKVMCCTFLSLESKLAPYTQKYRRSFNSRLKVRILYNSMVDPATGIFDYKYLLGSDFLPPDSVSVMNRLMSECNTIGFSISSEESDIIDSIEEYTQSI